MASSPPFLSPGAAIQASGVFFLPPSKGPGTASMKPVSFLRALSVAACVLALTPVPGAAQAPPSPSPAIGVAGAAKLIREGRFEEALTILRPLARGDRASERIVFSLGLAAAGAAEKPGIDDDRRTALLDEAIAAFRAMLVVDPEAGPGPPGARPRVLPEGRGRACGAAFRAGAGGPASGGGGAQRQPVPQHHARPQAVERCGSVRRNRARQQHLRPDARGDDPDRHPVRAPALHL